MSEPLDEQYFVWLYAQVSNPNHKNPRRTYWNLLRKLFTTEFIWFIPNDDARVEDGRDLRYEFLDVTGIRYVDEGWLEQGCSFLELLIGLSRRLAFETDSAAEAWFWHMLENVELHVFNDATKFSDETITEVTDRITWRTYNADGSGGLFPLKSPEKNQTKVELWYQLCAYIIENE